MKRHWEFDALRGLMLVLMTLTHLPTRFSSPFGQPFGFVSAAEGFVLLSGFMAGSVYTSRALSRGDADMRDAFFKRALKIYGCHAALLFFLFTFIGTIAIATDQRAVMGLMSYYLQHPLQAFLGGLLLLYNPPLLDILPMYVLFMLISPMVLLHGLHQGWRGILCTSIAMWLAAQFEFGSWLYDAAVALTGLPVPFSETGAFDILAWQFIWILGLWMGSVQAMPNPPVTRFPGWMVNMALVIGAVCLVWRHAVGQSPFPDHPELNLMFDKWQLAPLRLINLFALLVLVMHFSTWLVARLPRLRFLETMGAASLPVFCTHLALTLLVLAFMGESHAGRPLWKDIAILAVSFPLLYAVAWISQQIDRHAAALRARSKERARLLTARGLK
jgi:hypothetical protein